MVGTRKDPRGYVLRTGECYRADGRYSYGYTDRCGKRHTIYAKSLVDLRAREKDLQKKLLDGVDPFAAEKWTLNDMYDRYMSQKFNLKDTTKANYMYMYEHLVRDSLGKLKLASIKYTDVKRFYYELVTEKGIKPNTVETVHNTIHPALQLAVREEIIRINPSDGVMGELKRSRIWNKPKRHALTKPQQDVLMEYVTSNREYAGWVPIITVLIGTGMRIGECLGLRWCDVDFDKRVISVNHNLTDRPVPGENYCERHIQTPKTEAGTRIIPMIDEVVEAFLTEYQIQKCLGFCTEEIDGYSGFIFSTSEGRVYNSACINNALHRIRNNYNKEETKLAKKEKRDPVLLPSFSAHVLRHTFCTRFCENETNLKVIQEIMGHADIQTTMDIYAEATEEKKLEVFSNLQGKIF